MNSWKDPKTDCVAAFFVALLVLIVMKSISVEQALALIAAGAGVLAKISKDNDTGSTKPNEEVDAAVEKVENMPPVTKPKP
jgi:hypothetical protein